MWVGGLQAIVDDHPASFAHLRPQARARSSRGRMPAETIIISTSSVLPSVKHRLDFAITVDFLRDFVEVHMDAEVFDLSHQHS